MTGLGINAVFIVYPGGFACSNNGDINIEADVLKDIQGGTKSVRRTKQLKAKNSFIHKTKPEVSQQVTCLTRINIGNIFHYEGIVSYISDDYIGINLISNAQKDKIEEIIKTIVEL